MIFTFNMASEFTNKTVKELQPYLKQRGVSVSNLKKTRTH